MAVTIMNGPVMATPGSSGQRSTTALIDVGARGFSEDGEFVYVKAAEAIAVSGSPVSLSGGLAAVKIGDLDTGAFIGIAEAPFASGEYGYIRVKGPTLVIVESGAVAGDSLQLSGTATKLKKTTTSGDQVAIALAAADNASTAQISVYIGK